MFLIQPLHLLVQLFSCSEILFSIVFKRQTNGQEMVSFTEKLLANQKTVGIHPSINRKWSRHHKPLCQATVIALSLTDCHVYDQNLGSEREGTTTTHLPPPPPPPQYINSAASLGEMARNQAQVRGYFCHSPVSRHLPLLNTSTQQPAWGKWRGIRHR